MYGDEDDVKTADNFIEAMRLMRKDGKLHVLEELRISINHLYVQHIGDNTIDSWTILQVLEIIEQKEDEIREEENK